MLEGETYWGRRSIDRLDDARGTTIESFAPVPAFDADAVAGSTLLPLCAEQADATSDAAIQKARTIIFFFIFIAP